tara:strand:- start:186 stop:419 length:234 start_codon:yes stop_codon:yes gene_type:complete
MKSLFPNDDLSRLEKYKFGGRDVTAVHLLQLISEMEGTYQHLKYMGFEEDMYVIEEMKKRYYKLYFRINKQEKSMLE